MIGLTGLIMGSGWVNLLSGQIRRYQVGFESATQCTPANLLGLAGRAHGEDGWAAPNSARSRFPIKKFFFFFKFIL
jgi:hypothetical protein